MWLFRAVFRHAFLLVPPVFYLLTCAPTIGFGDTALIVDAIQRRIVGAHVNNHPFTVLMGILFSAALPFSDLAYRANLVSVFFGALTVMGFYWLVLCELETRLVAATAAGLLMISNSMWWHSTLIENYACSSLFIVTALLLWRRLRRTGKRGHLYSLCAVGGLSILNHVQNGFLCVGIAVTGILYAWPQRRERHRILARCALWAAAGLVPWLFLLLRDASRTGSLAVAVQGAFIGSFSQTFFSGAVVPSLLDTAYLFWFQSPTCFLLLGLFGIWLQRRGKPGDPTTAGMLTAFALNTFTFCFYATWDKFAFLLVSFVNLFFFGAIGLAAIWERVRASPPVRLAFYCWLIACFLLPPYAYAKVATWALSPESVWHSRYNNRYSDNLYFQSEYIVDPNKHGFYEVKRFADLLFDKLPPGAIFLDDDSRTYYPLAEYYQRFHKIRPDVSVVLVNSWGISNWGLGTDAVTHLMTRAYWRDRPLFLASLHSPHAQFIHEARKHLPLEFAKFPLAEGKWVYRLIPTSRPRLATHGLESAENLKGVSWLSMDAPAGYIDLSVSHILSVTATEPSVQDMSSFRGEWWGGDQLFFENSKAGAQVEFGIRCNRAVRVSVALHFTTAPDFGILELQVGPGGGKKKVDLYSASVGTLVEEQPEATLAPGVTRIVLRVVGKNPRSAGYRLGIDGLRYRRLPGSARAGDGDGPAGSPAYGGPR